MKKLIIILYAVLPLAVLSGPAKWDESKIAERVADDSAKASTNYVSQEAYIAQLNAATKFDELKAALVAKAASDKLKVDKIKEEKEKLK